MAFSELLDRAGGVGLFQALQVFTLFLPSVLVPSHMLIENFSAAGQLLAPNGTATNWSEAATEPCVDGWVYDRSTFTSTFVSEWDLVCDHKGLKPIGQSLYMTGLLIGSFCWGLLSNRYSHAELGPGPGTGSALLVEWTTTRRRAVTMTILGCIYSLGQMALGALAFTLRDWRTLQLAVSTPFFAIFLICWWLPESARWLIITGKPEQGLQELHKVAKINGHKEATKSLTIEVLMTSMEEEMASAKGHRSVLELFLVPMLRWRTCIMSLVFSQVTSYYGLVLDLQNLGNDIFLLQVLFGGVDLLARSITAFLLSFLGRRTTLASFQAMSGLSILVNKLVPQDWQTLRMVFAVLGKGCFGVVFSCVSVYKSELYPTALRKSAAATGNRREVVVTESTSF
uniref:Solute carrier family 22 member 11 n=1 Tax=Panthera tigris altaica TaxID=74533 RepID=A0A8C9JE29_PANTA